MKIQSEDDRAVFSVTQKSLKILGLLAIIPFSGVFTYQNLCGCLKDKRGGYIKALEGVMVYYLEKNEKFPATLDEINPEIKVDFWDHEVKYILEPQLVIIFSAADDGVFGTIDDVTYSKNLDLKPK